MAIHKEYKVDRVCNLSEAKKNSYLYSLVFMGTLGMYYLEINKY